jgi:hypothetical protein
MRKFNPGSGRSCRGSRNGATIQGKPLLWIPTAPARALTPRRATARAAQHARAAHREGCNI